MSTNASDTARSLRDQVNAILIEVRSLDVSKWNMNDVFAEIERYEIELGESLWVAGSDGLLPEEMTEAIDQAASKWRTFKDGGRKPVSEQARRRLNVRCRALFLGFINNLPPVAVPRGRDIPELAHSSPSDAYREHALLQQRKLQFAIFCSRLEKLAEWAQQAIEEAFTKPTGVDTSPHGVDPPAVAPFTLHCMRMEAGAKPGKPVSHRDIARRWLELHPDDKRTEEQVKKASEYDRVKRRGRKNPQNPG